MKIPAPMIPPITAMVVPNRPRCRASAPLWRDGLPGTSDCVMERGESLKREARAYRSAQPRSAFLGYGVQEFDERKDSAIHAVDLGVFRLDDVVLVRSMRAASVAEAKGTGGEVQRLAGENVTGPGARAARQNDRVDPALAIHSGFDADDFCVGGRAVGIVTAGHAHLDIAEALFRKVSFERGESFRGGHVRNEAQV